jgi:hypothetical protein
MFVGRIFNSVSTQVVRVIVVIFGISRAPSSTTLQISFVTSVREPCSPLPTRLRHLRRQTRGRAAFRWKNSARKQLLSTSISTKLDPRASSSVSSTVVGARHQVGAQRAGGGRSGPRGLVSGDDLNTSCRSAASWQWSERW